jgi:hypothetical protein
VTGKERALYLLGAFVLCFAVSTLWLSVLVVGFGAIDEASEAQWVGDLWFFGYIASLVVAGLVGRFA